MQFANTAKLLMDNLSRYRALRDMVPVLQLYADRNTSREARIKFSQKADSLQRSLLFWRYAPPKYKGGFFPNLFGFQLFRYLYLNLRFGIRPQQVGRSLPVNLPEDMRTQGYAIWPNALAPSDVKAILDFFDRHQDHKMNHFEDFSELVIATSRGPIRDTEDYQKIYALVRRACRWDEIGSSFARKAISISPYIAILHSRSWMHVPLQKDGQDTPHSDVCYPSFKVFFYLSDVDAGSAPFTYFRGSHKFGLSRALQEYRDSVRYFDGAKNDVKPISGRPFVENEGYPEVPLTGDRGTAIVFNVQGIHRRGDFSKDQDRERKVLLVDFRQVEAAFQRFAA